MTAARIRDLVHSFTVELPYEELAHAFDRARGRGLEERGWLERVVAAAPGKRMLDLGCGAGEPIARFFVDNGFSITGVDTPAMIAIARARFPEHTWIPGDMRTFEGGPFDAIVAWDSLFHLDRDAQRAMFPRFEKLLVPGGVLLFTSGTEDGEVIGSFEGRPLYHASLAESEYRTRLTAFDLLDFVHTDPNIGNHTIWLARLTTPSSPVRP